MAGMSPLSNSLPSALGVQTAIGVLREERERRTIMARRLRDLGDLQRQEDIVAAFKTIEDALAASLDATRADHAPLV